MSVETLVTVFPATHARETESIKKCIGLENTHQTQQTHSPPAADAPEWVLTFRALPDDVHPDLRVRQLLKIGLRRFKLRCVRLGPPVSPVTNGVKHD